MIQFYIKNPLSSRYQNWTSPRNIPHENSVGIYNFNSYSCMRNLYFVDATAFTIEAVLEVYKLRNTSLCDAVKYSITSSPSGPTIVFGTFSCT
jgi:hypothetical protein